MPVRRQIPESRRRSRKGCLPCRKRHAYIFYRERKLTQAVGGEERPSCANCASRNVNCEYGAWTFVSLGIPPADDHDKSHIDETTSGTLAQDKETFTECIMYCARFRHRPCPTLVGTDDDVRARGEILYRISLEDNFTAEICRAFLAVTDLFITPISRWRTLVTSYSSGYSSWPQNRNFQGTEEPLKSLQRLYC